MAVLDSRGHEVVSSKRVEVPFIQTSSRLDIFSIYQSMIARQKMEMDDQIADDADVIEDMNDFSSPEDYAPGMPVTGDTVYTVPDSVPDGFSAEEYRTLQAEAKAKADAQAKPDSNVSESTSVSDS
ncbi:hypothetical protein [Chicken microvirus mg7_20]|nr:hypothetical protein [Chicken microvirus mg7_20]